MDCHTIITGAIIRDCGSTSSGFAIDLSALLDKEMSAAVNMLRKPKGDSLVLGLWGSSLLPRWSASSRATRCVTLPGSTGPGSRKVTSNLISSRKERRWSGRQWWRKRQDVGSCTICTNVILLSSELSTFCSNSFEILLGWSIGVADLKEQTLFTNGLAMKFLDNFVTNISRFKSTSLYQWLFERAMMGILTVQNQHPGYDSDYHEGFCLIGQYNP